MSRRSKAKKQFNRGKRVNVVNLRTRGGIRL